MSSPSPTNKKPEHDPSPLARSHGGRHKKHAAHDAPHVHDESNWLVSYADMMTLLFGFFVLMYSFSRIDEKKFEVVRKDVARYFGGTVKTNPTVKKVEKEMEDIITAAGIDKNVQLVARDSELELRFQGSFHFIPGTANLTSESAFILGKLIDTLKRTVKADAISVEGHTDDNPIASVNFPSNWELSASRASSVVREFEKFGFDPTKMTAKGFGSSRPIVPNRDSKGEPLPENQDLNRRVIVNIEFNREIDDAMRAMKTGQFVSADNPETVPDRAKTSLVHEGEGEPTWREKVTHDFLAVQDKLKLAEERLKETEEKRSAAKQLSDMQGRLKQIEQRIVTSETQTKNYINGIPTDNTARAPASKAKAVKPAKGKVKGKAAAVKTTKAAQPKTPARATASVPAAPAPAAAVAPVAAPAPADSAPPAGDPAAAQ